MCFFILFQAAACILIVAMVLGGLIFVYARSSLVSSFVNAENCILYSVLSIEGDVAKVAPFLIWSLVIAQIVPWVVEMVLCVKTIVHLKKAAMFRAQAGVTQQQGASGMSSAELKMTWLLVTYGLCHTTSNSPESVYLISIIFIPMTYTFAMTSYYVAIISPVLKMIITLPFTVKALETSRDIAMEEVTGLDKHTIIFLYIKHQFSVWPIIQFMNSKAVVIFWQQGWWWNFQVDAQKRFWPPQEMDVIFLAPPPPPPPGVGANFWAHRPPRPTVLYNLLYS